MTDRLNGISSMATRQVLTELTEPYERQTGTQVSIRSLGGVEAARLVRAGEAADVVILAAKGMEELEAEGHVVRGTRAGFARSGIGMAVRSGARLPGSGDEEAVRQAMLDAGRVCYAPGPSGDHLIRRWERWG